MGNIYSPNGTECTRKYANNNSGCQKSCSGLYADITNQISTHIRKLSAESKK